MTASALVATVGDFKQFKNGAQFGSWLGLVPRQNSSGGKTVLGRITKRGDDYLRTLLIQGAKSAVMTRAQTQRQDLAMAGAAARPRGLAKGGGGVGQQERAHRLGAAGQGARVRSELRVGQAWRRRSPIQAVAPPRPETPIHDKEVLPRRHAFEDAITQVRPAAGKLD